MKLNLQFYDEMQDTKPILEEEKEIMDKIQEYEGENVSELLNDNSKITDVLALSEARENILNWYEFKQDSIILQLNANYGEITGLLCNKAKKVVAIESSKKYANIIEKRYQNKENLELIVGNLKNIKIQEEFDYIVINGMPENMQEAIYYAKEHLKEDGIILLAVNNKFGIKAWNTMKEEVNIIHNKNTAISKNKLEKMLEGMHYRYYYPLPDYKLPNIIYTDKYMPTLSNIYRNLTYCDGGNNNFDEISAYNEIIKNNAEDFKIFANSFLIEISNKDLKENNIQFITFSNIRKDEYRIKTVIKKEKVYKTNVNEKSKKHIQNIQKNIDLLNELGIKILDTYEENQIISKYVKEKTLEDKLIEIYENEGKESFFKEIEKYKIFLIEKLKVTEKIENNVFEKYNINCEKINLEKLTFVKYGFWDLIFQNCFIIENEYYFYDQEWLEENIPVEYIIYRAILNFHESKQYISDIEIFEKLNITEFISIFKELDDKLQLEIRKPLVWKIHCQEELEKNELSNMKKEIQKKETEIGMLKERIEKVKNEINIVNKLKEKVETENINLKNKNDEKNKEIANLKNSFSWKLTKPLRFVRKMIK